MSELLIGAIMFVLVLGVLGLFVGWSKLLDWRASRQEVLTDPPAPAHPRRIMSRLTRAERDQREQVKRAGVITNLQARNAMFSAQTKEVQSSTDVTPNSNEEVTVNEAALIGKLLGQGTPPSAVVKALPGYTPAKYKEYRAKVDLVMGAIEEVLTDGV